MTKNIQDTPSLVGVGLPFGRSEGGGDSNGIQVNPARQVDEDSRNGNTVELKEDLVNEKDSSYQGASTLLRNMVLSTYQGLHP